MAGGFPDVDDRIMDIKRLYSAMTVKVSAGLNALEEVRKLTPDFVEAFNVILDRCKQANDLAKTLEVQGNLVPDLIKEKDALYAEVQRLKLQVESLQSEIDVLNPAETKKKRLKQQIKAQQSELERLEREVSVGE